MDKKSYVFISYSSVDSLFVTQVTNLLKSCNITYWKAPEMIPVGSNYAREIPKAIRSCDAFILILSKASQNSIWVEKEVDVAICCRKRIIPIKIDNEPLNELYHFYLNNVQTVNVCPVQRARLSRGDKERLKLLFQESVCDNATKVVQQEVSKSGENVTMVKENVVEKSQITEDTKKQQPDLSNRNFVDTRSNALRMNRIPLQCENCGSRLEQTRMGIYVCVDCGKEHYDDYRKVRNYLERVGAASAAIIARDTGVSRKTIEYFRENGFIESR